MTLVTDLGLALRPPGVDVVALGEALTRTVSLAYRTNTARRAALMLVVDAVRTAAAEKGLGADTALPAPTTAEPDPAPVPDPAPSPDPVAAPAGRLGLR